MTQVSAQIIAQNALRDAQRALDEARASGDQKAIEEAQAAVLDREFDLVVAGGHEPKPA